MIIKKLIENEINDSLKLAYEIYVLAMGWTPDANNKSNYRIEKGILLDDFVKQSTYFGVYDEQTMVGTCRIIRPNKNGVEFSRYFDNNGLINHKTAEINRFAVKADYLNTLAPILLFSESIKWSFHNLDLENIVTSVQYPEPGKFLEKIGFTKETEEFHYGQNDLYKVNLMNFVVNEKNKLLVLNMMENLIQKIA